ncbi:MAG: hypothetical protein V4574_11675 [Pseudomonadota bacterium]
MRGLWTAAILAALAGAMPAAAADLATLGCVRDQMTAPVRAEIASSARALADGKSAAASQGLRDGLRLTADACAKRHGWSDAAREAAQTHALVAASLEALRPLAPARGVDLAVITAALHSLTDAQRAQILNQEQAGTDALLAQLVSRGLVVTGEAQGSLVGVLAVLTLIEETQKARFAAS